MMGKIQDTGGSNQRRLGVVGPSVKAYEEVMCRTSVQAGIAEPDKDSWERSIQAEGTACANAPSPKRPLDIPGTC